jgi:hypothetical protein
MPPGIDQALALVGDDYAGVLDWNAYEIVHSGLLTGIQNPARTIVIRERQPVPTWDGRWAKAYGFADGHSEIHAESDSDFQEWENARLPTP